jgi:hypothetical protein
LIAKNCLGLEHLEIDGCVCVTDDLLDVLAEHCRHLKELRISDCPLVTVEAVAKLKQKMPELTCPSPGRAEFA